jgi:hypothetical protein
MTDSYNKNETELKTPAPAQEYEESPEAMEEAERLVKDTTWVKGLHGGGFLQNNKVSESHHVCNTWKNKLPFFEARHPNFKFAYDQGVYDGKLKCWLAARIVKDD